ncbi:hypothetical protein DEU56DRAFT_928517, partial [Suillus clintonianus]|uniref:uncharacterized protein n=1 Tax=Suillus clintonianus TaxID=1904413 RepID=UPI001B867D92
RRRTTTRKGIFSSFTSTITQQIKSPRSHHQRLIHRRPPSTLLQPYRSQTKCSSNCTSAAQLASSTPHPSESPALAHPSQKQATSTSSRQQRSVETVPPFSSSSLPARGHQGHRDVVLDWNLHKAATGVVNSRPGLTRDDWFQSLRSDGIVGLYRGSMPSVVGICVYRGLYRGGYGIIRDTFLVGNLRGNFAASFAVGWMCTTSPGSFLLHTIRRRMMMTSGEKVQYKFFINAGRHIMAKEGAKSLFAGAGANIVAGAGVLSLYDK